MAAPTLHVELLGGFRVLAGGRVPAAQPSARQQELIAFLVLHARNARVPRQRVAGTLWPDSTNSQALTNLRRELHNLRDGSPQLAKLLDPGSRTLAWRGEPNAFVDLVAFEAAAGRGLAGDHSGLQEAARLYKGDLLPDCPGQWIDADRERLRRRAAAVLSRLVDLFEQDRSFGEAVECARHVLRLDPLDERAWCALMRCHARRGERATALHLYQQCVALLKKELGIPPNAATRATYREILDLDAGGPPPPAPRKAVYTLAGRTSEWRALMDGWRAAASGRARLFLIRGEAGIGKSRLAEELADWCSLKNVNTATARCYAGEGRLAYAPIAAWLQSDALRATLNQLDASCLTDLARLRPEIAAEHPEIAPADGALESWQRLRFFEALARAFRSASPLALFLDDIQWADADTAGWLQYFLRSAAETPCLVVATLRVEEEQDNPALGPFFGRLEHDGRLTAIALGPLDEQATAALASEVAEQPLDGDASARAFSETEGHPLFIVARGLLGLPGGGDRPGDDAHTRVQSVLAARLALLSEDARAAAEMAAAVGRDFRFDILAAASDLEESALVRALDELWRRHIVRVQADERWDFTHDRIREVAYAGIGPARRRLVHRRIAQGMELLFAGRLDEASASIAMHLEAGGQPARAILFLERAAAVATRVSANEEAIRCLTRALSLLEKLQDDRERDDRELKLRSALSVVLNSARGYAAPEVEQNLDRVFTLLRAAGRDEVPVHWIWAAFALRFVRGDLKRTREFAELALSRSISDASCRCEAHHAMGAAMVSTGELEAARHHFEAALAAYDERDPRRSSLGSDLGVFSHAWYAHALWLLGDEDAAVLHAGQAVALARRQDHPYSETLALAYSALLHQMRRDAAEVLRAAHSVVQLCDRYDFGYYGEWARVLIGWAHGQERPAEGIETIEAAFERLDATRAQARRSYYLSLLAELYTLLGNPVRSASILDAAISIALERGDTWWLPALYLQRGMLVGAPTRDAMLQRALELARAQGSRRLERRILASLVDTR